MYAERFSSKEQYAAITVKSKYYLPENKRLFIVHGVEPVVLNDFSSVLLADSVRGQAIHVHFYVGAYFPV